MPRCCRRCRLWLHRNEACLVRSAIVLLLLVHLALLLTGG